MNQAGQAVDGLPSAAAGSAPCWRCGAATAPSPFCSFCGAIVALPPDADHYQVFGIPRRLDLDGEALAARYYELSRQLHPDRHGAGPAAARDASLHNQAALTRAYRDLRDPLGRARYWLELHGIHLGDDNRVPPELASRVFEVQEQLDELASASGAARDQLVLATRRVLESLRREAEEMAGQTQALFAESDRGQELGVLPRLKALLSRRSYLATLIRDVEAALRRAS